MGLRTVARIEARHQDAFAAGRFADEEMPRSDQLLAFVPSETLAPTTAMFGALASVAWWTRLAIVAIAVVHTPIWIWINYVNAAVETAAMKEWPVWSICFGVVAYLIWVGSIPGSPYLRWHIWSLRIGAGAALRSAAVCAALFAGVALAAPGAALAGSLSVQPGRVPAGGTVTATGGDWGQAPPVQLTVDGLGPTTTTPENGAFSASLVIPLDAKPGDLSVAACQLCDGSDGQQASVTVEQRLLTLSRDQAPPGGTVDAHGEGFRPATAGTLSLDDAAGSEVGTFTTDTGGAFTTTAMLPPDVTNGSHVIVVCLRDCRDPDLPGPQLSQSLTVAAPVLSLEPTQITRGEPLTVSGSGWDANADGSIAVDAAPPTTTFTSRVNGSFTATLTLAANSAAGQHSITVCQRCDAGQPLSEQQLFVVTTSTTTTPTSTSTSTPTAPSTSIPTSTPTVPSPPPPPPPPPGGGGSWTEVIGAGIAIVLVLLAIRAYRTFTATRSRHGYWEARVEGKRPKRCEHAGDEYCHGELAEVVLRSRRLTELAVELERRDSADGPFAIAVGARDDLLVLLNKALHARRERQPADVVEQHLVAAARGVGAAIEGAVAPEGRPCRAVVTWTVDGGEVEATYTRERCLGELGGFEWNVEEKWKAKVNDKREWTAGELDRVEPRASLAVVAVPLLAAPFDATLAMILSDRSVRRLRGSVELEAELKGEWRP